MPELPEVETVRRGLDKLIVGKTIQSIEVLNSPRSFQGDADSTAKFVVGSSVTAVRRRAKLLMIDLSTSYTLLVHLKMTGQMVYRGQQNFGAGHPNDSLIGELPDRSTRVVFEFDDRSHLYFNDQRRFGWVKPVPTMEITNVAFVSRLGPEPFDEALTPEIFISRMRRRNRSVIKAALLDQSVIAGVGNIYADESLWGAKIHPARRIESVTDAELTKLLKEVRTVLQLSLDHGGSTDRNYVDAEGKRGSYLKFAKVFRRENQPCPRCGATIIKTRVAGRGTHICPVCQVLETASKP